MPDLHHRIMQAHAAIRPAVPVTPLQHSPGLSALLGCTVLLKAEHLLPTGSFKLRGATNKLRILGAAARNGVIAASTGNHGLAVAHAAAAHRIPATIFVPETASPAKTSAIQALGATLAAIPGPPIAAELEARRQSEITGLPYISPYNDIDVIAGQGTIGVELHDQAPGLDAVFVAVGGGGLVSGIATALEAASPSRSPSRTRTRIVGVWPENSPCMLRAMQAGAIIDVPEHPTLSDGTAGAIEPGAITLPLCTRLIHETVTVTEPEIARAMHQVADIERWIIEGAAAALAGLVASAPRYRGATVAVILCGRNIALPTFLAAIDTPC